MTTKSDDLSTISAREFNRITQRRYSQKLKETGRKRVVVIVHEDDAQKIKDLAKHLNSLRK